MLKLFSEDASAVSAPPPRRGARADVNRPASAPGTLPSHIARATWPLLHMSEAVQAVSAHAGLGRAPAETVRMPAAVAEGPDAELERWTQWLADWLSLDISFNETTVAELHTTLQLATPAVVLCRLGSDTRLLAIVAGRKDKLVVLAPDFSTHQIDVQDICDALLAPLSAAAERDLALMVQNAQLPQRQAVRITQALTRERLATKRISGIMTLARRRTGSLARSVLSVRTVLRSVTMLALTALGYALEIGSWALIGSAVLNGRFDRGWLLAWVLTTVTVILIRFYAGTLNASLTIEVARIIKSRLMAGSLTMDNLVMRKEGAGTLMSRVMEAQTLEQSAIAGAFSAAVSVVEILFSIWILYQGAGGIRHVLLLVLWLVILAWMGRTYVRSLEGWTMRRTSMTSALLERMMGHRTVLAQDSRARRDTENDAMMHDYHSQSLVLDRAVVRLMVILPGAWAVASICSFVPGFVSGTVTAPELAIGIGGMLFAGRALGGITAGLATGARGLVAWRGVQALLVENERAAGQRPFVPKQSSLRETEGKVLLTARNVNFRYGSNPELALERANLTLHHGDRVLISGSSGGGKSTLASLVTGLNQPQSGLLLLKGLDRQTLGDDWHHFTTQASQFHDNHIFNGSLAFNLLMGRRWPAAEEDIQEATDICMELGLGKLLERMPAGLMQTVGETGWQLSHGERSRIFLARALLQDAELTVLDESFAALDPETLKLCLDCCFNRARTLVVIAHP